MNKNYHLFAWTEDYDRGIKGGLTDWRGAYTSIEEAKEALAYLYYQHAHIARFDGMMWTDINQYPEGIE